MAVKPPDPTRQRNFYFINGKRGEKTKQNKKNTKGTQKLNISAYSFVSETFYIYIHICFWRKKNPEMDNFGSKGKILWKMSTFLMNTKVAKMSQKMFAYSFVSEHSKLLFIFWL